MVSKNINSIQLQKIGNIETSQAEEQAKKTNKLGLGEFYKQLSKIDKTKALILFSVVALTLILLPTTFSSTKSRSPGVVNFFPLVKRNLEKANNNKIYLRQVYHQEQLEINGLERYSSPADTTTSSFNCKRLYGPQFQTKKGYYRIKKRNIENSILAQRQRSKGNPTVSKNQLNIEDQEFSIKTKIVNNETQVGKGNSDTNGSSSKYRSLAVQPRGYNLESNDKTESAQSGIIAETELTKIGYEFRSSKLGSEISFWKTPKQSDRALDQALDWAIQLISSLIPKKPNNEEPKSDWKYEIKDNLKVPDVSDKETLLSLARMASNAYDPRNSTSWEYLGKNWKTKSSFGWNSSGLRGYVFASEKNDTVVISFKGTSSSFFSVGAGLTSENDRINDNRLFSCCCAQGITSLKPSCGCFAGENRCNSTCLENSVQGKNTFILSASKIVKDVIKNYPKSNVVLTGHSLGASIASLTGLNFGLPAVAFESPGDLLAAKRLKLPVPQESEFSKLPIYHIGHTADPIFLGNCAGRNSPCFIAGYSIESKCHLGNECIFDTVKYLKWNQDILHHRISEVINLVLDPWVSRIANTAMPSCKPNIRCRDCTGWEFV